MIQEIAIMAVPLLLALSMHEAAHGFVAYLLGDPTAKHQGRLTLNPLKHLDPIGTIVFFIARIGWARPVPVNPRYFKNPRLGMALVALAGPGSNFLMALVFAALFHMIAMYEITSQTDPALKVLIPLLLICKAGVMVNLILAFFNLMPIPPLDGSRIVSFFLPPRLAYQFDSLDRYGMFILLGVILASNFFNLGIIGKLIFPAVSATAGLLGLPSF